MLVEQKGGWTMTINDLLNELVDPKSDSGCTSRQRYEHCASTKKDQPDCFKKGNPNHC